MSGYSSIVPCAVLSVAGAQASAFSGGVPTVAAAGFRGADRGEPCREIGAILGRKACSRGPSSSDASGCRPCTLRARRRCRPRSGRRASARNISGRRSCSSRCRGSPCRCRRGRARARHHRALAMRRMGAQARSRQSASWQSGPIASIRSPAGILARRWAPGMLSAAGRKCHLVPRFAAPASGAPFRARRRCPASGRCRAA